MACSLVYCTPKRRLQSQVHAAFTVTRTLSKLNEILDFVKQAYQFEGLVDDFRMNLPENFWVRVRTKVYQAEVPLLSEKHGFLVVLINQIRSLRDTSVTTLSMGHTARKSKCGLHRPRPGAVNP
ncbi:hypothetical protein TNCV_1500711 [Trichonephila clavipes]|nr:hypothetical protein TNCV_1500711 [Trichonephila clavipes]